MGETNVDKHSRMQTLLKGLANPFCLLPSFFNAGLAYKVICFNILLERCTVVRAAGLLDACSPGRRLQRRRSENCVLRSSVTDNPAEAAEPGEATLQ